MCVNHLHQCISTNKYITLWRAVFSLLQGDHSQVAAVAAAKDAVSHNMGQRLANLQQCSSTVTVQSTLLGDHAWSTMQAQLSV